jgi:hypothetical protein
LDFEKIIFLKLVTLLNYQQEHLYFFFPKKHNKGKGTIFLVKDYEFIRGKSYFNEIIPTCFSEKFDTQCCNLSFAGIVVFHLCSSISINGCRHINPMAVNGRVAPTAHICWSAERIVPKGSSAAWLTCSCCYHLCSESKYL